MHRKYVEESINGVISLQIVTVLNLNIFSWYFLNFLFKKLVRVRFLRWFRRLIWDDVTIIYLLNFKKWMNCCEFFLMKPCNLFQVLDFHWSRRKIIINFHPKILWHHPKLMYTTDMNNFKYGRSYNLLFKENTSCISCIKKVIMSK